MEMLLYSDVYLHNIYMICFRIEIVTLNMTFCHFFMYKLEISQNVWLWKFNLEDWKSPGNPMCMNPVIYICT